MVVRYTGEVTGGVRRGSGLRGVGVMVVVVVRGCAGDGVVADLGVGRGGGHGGQRPVAAVVGGGRWWQLFFYFLRKIFAECFFALGNVFAECTTKNTRQTSVCRKGVCRV